MRPPAEGTGYSGRGTPAVQHRGKSRLKRAAAAKIGGPTIRDSTNCAAWFDVEKLKRRDESRRGTPLACATNKHG
jgi:hypothetical protein